MDADISRTTQLAGHSIHLHTYNTRNLWFVFSVIGCWLYNLIASKVGGVELILEDVESEEYL